MWSIFNMGEYMPSARERWCCQFHWCVISSLASFALIRSEPSEVYLWSMFFSWAILPWRGIFLSNSAEKKCSLPFIWNMASVTLACNKATWHLTDEKQNLCSSGWSGVWVEGNQIPLKDPSNIYDNSPLLSYFTDGCYSIFVLTRNK